MNPTGGWGRGYGGSRKGILPGDKIASGGRAQQLQNYTPEQMELYQRNFENVAPESYLARLSRGDQDLFNEQEAPAFRQFNEQLGNISSRFSGGGGGQGALSARRSSGFQNTTNQAASDFASQLQSQRQGLMRQAILDMQGISHQLLNERPYDRFIQEKGAPKPSKWGGLAGAGLGGAAGFLAGGPSGAWQGAQLGYGVGKQF